MENTTENKLKFFAPYYGQKVLKNKNYSETTVLNGHFFFHSACYAENYHLELRSTDSITDDECIAFFDFLFPLASKMPDNDNAGKVKAIKYMLSSMDNKECEPDWGTSGSRDWLRSKDFLIDFMDMTKEQLLEYGWAKIKTKE